MGCLDANVIVRLMDGTLPPGPAAQAEKHIDECADCAALVGKMAQIRTEQTGARHRDTLATPSADGATSDGDDNDATRRDDAAPYLPRLAARAANDTSAEPLALGAATSLGRYRIRAHLGQGGMGAVFSAFDPFLERTVALKVLRHDAAGSDPHANERLVREARAMAKLAHPHVVAVYDVGEAEGRVFVAMEYVEGETLRHWRARAPRSRAEVLRVLLDAGRGLQAAHAVGVVHRDFKPDNVLIDTVGRVKVADFGLAHAVGRAASGAAAESTAAAGTPAYMAPEQWLGGAVGPWADQFAFCVAAYEALYGVRPFKGRTARERLAHMVSGVPEAPASFGAAAWALPILLRGMSPQPEDRFESMDALLDALSREKEQRVERALASVVTGLWVMTALHWGIVALFIAALTLPDRQRALSAAGAWGEIARMLLMVMQATLLIWLPLGVVWAPACALALGRKKQWAWRSANAYAWLSVFTGMGTPFGLFALWNLSRPGVRPLAERGRVSYARSAR